jgi:aldehyde dehydrogenase (NAD+)
MGSIEKPLETQLFINGEFVPSSDKKTFPVSNPHNHAHVADVYEATVSDVDHAVSAAEAAFPAWSALGAGARTQWLNKLGDAIEKRLTDIAYLESICMGKPVNTFTEAAAMGFWRWYTGKGYDIQGTTSLNSPGFVAMTFRQPFGATAAIIPWNAAFLMLAVKVVPALIAGNTMVLKTSEKSPLSCLVAAQCMQEIEFPKGVLNILSGHGRPAGEALAKHMRIRKIAFTGSTATGKAVQKAAAESNLKNVTLELGGKSPLIVFEDADLAKAAPGAAFSILTNSGQACVASSRIYVHEKVADEFVELVKGALAQMGSSGDPLEQGTTRGPQADSVQFERVMGFLEGAKREGLEIVVGGGREEGKDGFYVQPTILRNVPEDARIVKEEVFGPVVVINTFSDEDEVLRRANDSEYGLYGSVFTRDISRALRVAKRIEAGLVGINNTSPNTVIDMPFGGWKGSGIGREGSQYAFEHWTELKTVVISE